jgi:hypothetical protein
MLTNHPLTYLRLSLFLDLTLSRGKTPHVTDLPLWTIDTTNALQAHNTSLSSYSMLPFVVRDTSRRDSEARVIEVNDDEGGELPQQCKFYLGACDSSQLTLFLGATFEQAGSLVFPAFWSFADVDVPWAWFEST